MRWSLEVRRKTSTSPPKKGVEREEESKKEEGEEKPSERVENDTPLALQENAPTPPPATPMGEAACQKRGARKTVELGW